MEKKWRKRVFSNGSGFSLLEVLLGVTIFMIGMLGVTALNISSLKSNTFSGNMSEAVTIAGDKLEEILAMDYNDPSGDLDDSPSPDDDGILGLDDIGTGAGEADHWELGVGKNGIYDVYWNVAEDEPIPNCKIVNVIVRWQIKDVWRQINMSITRVREL